MSAAVGGPRAPIGPSGPRVLVALKDAEDLGTIRGILGKLCPDYEFTHCSRAAEAFRLVETYEYRAAIVAYDQGWGVKVLNRLARLQPRCVRVLVTAEGTDPELRDAVQVGRVHVLLSAPLDPQRTYEVLERACHEPTPEPISLAEASGQGADPVARLDVQLPTPVALQLHAMAVETGKDADTIVAEALARLAETWTRGKGPAKP